MPEATRSGKTRLTARDDHGSAEWPTALYPSPKGRYLGYGLRLYEGNVVLLENH
jgi:hypothetical protein